MRLETRMGTLSFERSTRPTIQHRRFMARLTSNALAAVFVICSTRRAIAQTTTNQPSVFGARNDA